MHRYSDDEICDCEESHSKNCCPKYNDVEEKTSFRKLRPEAVSDSFRHENDRSKEGEDWGVNDAMHCCPGGDKCGCKACHTKNCCQKWDNPQETSCRKLTPKSVTDSFKHEKDTDRSQEGNEWNVNDAMHSCSSGDKCHCKASQSTNSCQNWDNPAEHIANFRKLKPGTIADSFQHENDRCKEGKEWGVNDAMHNCSCGVDKCGCKASHLANCYQKWDNAEEKTSCRILKPGTVTDSFKHENDRSKENEEWGVNDSMHSYSSGADKCGCKASHLKNCCQNWDNPEENITFFRKLKPGTIADSFEHENDRCKEGKEWGVNDAMHSCSCGVDKCGCKASHLANCYQTWDTPEEKVCYRKLKSEAGTGTSKHEKVAYPLPEWNKAEWNKPEWNTSQPAN